MIKIVSAFTYPAGPVPALVELCNLFNAHARACIFYGPDNWHLDKCRAAPLADFLPQHGDIVIIHGFELSSAADLQNLPELVASAGQRRRLGRLRGMLAGITGKSGKPDDFRLVATIQGEDNGRIDRSALAYSHKSHYVSKELLTKKRLQTGAFVCPNPVGALQPSPGKPEKIAGVIGSIRRENDTASSIEKALLDGMETVFVYGYLQEPIFYYRDIEPLTRKYPGRIKFAGFIDDKQKLYDSISDVYCSVRRPWSTVRRECLQTHTRYHGPGPLTEEESMSDEQIFELWKNELGL